MGKTLIYTLSDGIGGVEEYVLNLSRFRKLPSSKYGYIVLGESTPYKEELERLGVEYFFVPKKKALFSNIKRLKSVLKECRKTYDTIYFNTSGLYYPVPYVFAKIYKYRLVLHSHSSNGEWPKSIIHLINRSWIIPRVDARLACSIYAGKWMFGKKDFAIIPNAIDIKRFKFSESKRNELRDLYGIQDKFVIGNIGRLHKGKNQIFLIQILRKLIENNIDAVLVLVGDGELRETIIEKSREYRISDRVIFVGMTNCPEHYYSVMDCFLLPSFVEGFPITLIEAQANGVPCIVSDSVTKETNVSGMIQYLSIYDEPDEWVKCILDHGNRYECIELLKEKGFDVTDLWEKVEEYT